MNKDEEAKWMEFRDLMTFLDDMRNRGLWICRRTSEKEQKRTDQLFVDINWNAQEKMVRRYLGLPSRETIEMELDTALKDLRERHARDAVLEVLPS